MPSCPWCEVALSRVIGVSGARYACPRCGGAALGRDVAERMFASEAVAGAWQAARDGDVEECRCPFCSGPLRRGAAGVSVCRPCEMLWLDAGAADRLAPVATRRARCPRCGAPWVTASDGSCRCCHRVGASASALFSASGEHDRSAPGRWH